METECLGEITNAMLPLRPLFENDPATTDRRMLERLRGYAAG